jgi:putative membrane protein
MIHYLALWLLTAVAFIITAYVVPGIRIASFGAAMGAAIIMGVVNVLVRPVLVLLTLPVTILTLGLFLLVVNALCLKLVGALTPGIQVKSFGTAIIGSLVLSIVSSILHWLALSI